jgi:aminoglycoside phosphotransferase (APT) family kinase protein
MIRTGVDRPNHDSDAPADGAALSGTAASVAARAATGARLAPRTQNNEAFKNTRAIIDGAGLRRKHRSVPATYVTSTLTTNSAAHYTTIRTAPSAKSGSPPSNAIVAANEPPKRPMKGTDHPGIVEGTSEERPVPARNLEGVSDTIEMRPGEALDAALLEPYLRARLPETEGPFEVRQFGGGHANLTYQVRFGEREYVLRRPPYGPLPKGGHDMKREHRVLSVLWETFPLAPRAYLLCTDPDVIGSDFVVMERRHGVVIRREMPPSVANDPAAARRLSENYIDTLAALHSVDYTRAGLADLGRPEGYLQRQLAGWVERWRAAQTPGCVDASRLVERLLADPPQSGPPGLVHNDFKLDNCIMKGDDPAEFEAVLDWDMCTLGDPLSDVGNMLALWMEPADSQSMSNSMMPTFHPGFLSRAAMVERYAATTGRDCSRIDWYHAFNIFRYAAIAQQIYARYVRGQTSDPRFATFDLWVRFLIDSGTEMADRGI